MGRLRGTSWHWRPGFAFAGYLIALRETTLRYTEFDPSLLAGGGFLLAATCAWLTRPLHGASFLPSSGLPLTFWLTTVADGVLVCTFYCAIARASRWILPAEMAMVQLLEYVAGPLVVSLAGRAPSPSFEVLTGGALLLCSLLAHETLGLLAEQGHPLGTCCDVSFSFASATKSVLPTPAATVGLRQHGLKEASSGHELQALVEPSDRNVKDALPRSPRNRCSQAGGSSFGSED